MEEHLDYAAVQRYWDDAASGAAAASYMAHEQGLPQSCVRHRFTRERVVVERWLRGVTSASAILDVGCGGGAWTSLFAQRYRRVVAVDVSAKMLAAASSRLEGLANVELIEGDLTLEDRSVSDGTHELYALLHVGTCVIDADTGVARIEGSYLVDGLIGDWLMLGAAGHEGGRLSCRFEISAAEWQGELNVPDIDLG